MEDEIVREDLIHAICRMLDLIDYCRDRRLLSDPTDYHADDLYVTLEKILESLTRVAS